MFLDFDGIENVRDLGGLRRADGAAVKEGLLLRTGRLTRASDADIRRLQEMGIRHVIDFRDSAEIERDPDREVPGAAHHSLPALPSLEQHFKKPDDPTYTAEEIRRDFSHIYTLLAGSPASADAYESFFRILLEDEGAPVLFHCTQGKDRTGIAALLVLTALGFDEDTIVRDYMLTNEFTGRLLREIEEMEAPPFPADAAREVFLVYEDNLRRYVRCLELEYGSVMNYLELALGVGPREIEKLEDIYLQR